MDEMTSAFLGNAVLKPHLSCAVRHKGSSTAAAAHQLHAVMVKLILFCQGVDGCVNLFKVLIQDLGRQFLHRDA